MAMTPEARKETITRLRRLLAEATPGPWNSDRDHPAIGHMWISGPPPEELTVAESHFPDAELIVTAVNALPDLLDALEAAEQREKELEDILAVAVDIHGEPCRFDHHGFCQAHNLQEGQNCWVWQARAALSTPEETSTNG